MPISTRSLSKKLDHDATTLSIPEITSFVQDALGQRIAAYLLGFCDAKEMDRYGKAGPTPDPGMNLRFREGYKIVQMILETFDEKTARAWLFGTNAHLDDEAPIDVLRQATDPAQFAEVRDAAQHLLGFSG